MHPDKRIGGMVRIALFAVLLSVCAWISIPAPVPFTLQTFGLFLALRLLGGRQGCACLLLYLLMGALGLPVFAGGTGGLGILLGPTGGYLLGWLPAGLLLWLLEAPAAGRAWAQLLSMVLGLLVCYACGTAWFLLAHARQAGLSGLWAGLSVCVLPFLLPDLVKLLLAQWLSRRLRRLPGLFPR